MSKIKLPRKYLLAEAVFTGGQLGLTVTVVPIAMGQWVIEVRGSEQAGLPLASFYTGREKVALAYLAGLLAGAQLPKEGE